MNTKIINNAFVSGFVGEFEKQAIPVWLAKTLWGAGGTLAGTLLGAGGLYYGSDYIVDKQKRETQKAVSEMVGTFRKKHLPKYFKDYEKIYFPKIKKQFTGMASDVGGAATQGAINKFYENLLPIGATAGGAYLLSKLLFG